MFKKIGAMCKSCFTKLNIPAKIYLALFLIALFMNFTRLTWGHILYSLIFASFWTYALQYVGTKYDIRLSYVGVFLPFAAMYFVRSWNMPSTITQMSPNTPNTK